MIKFIIGCLVGGTLVFMIFLLGPMLDDMAYRWKKEDEHNKLMRK
jgi:hypothetical protein